MKLFDKLKNAFFEEEYVEVVEKKKEVPITREPVAKKIDLPEPKLLFDEEEDDEIVLNNANDNILSDRDLLKNDDFRFPILDDDDFKELEIPKEEVVEEIIEEPLYTSEPVVENNYYSNAEYEFHDEGPYSRKEDKKTFRPSPVISPVYGMLDRNYHKEEIVAKKEIRSSYERDKIDLDMVRKKAYGVNKAIEDEYEEPVSFEVEETTVNMNDGESTPAVEKVTIADAEEYFQDLGLEYNVDYKDNTKEKAKGRRSSKSKEEPVKNDESLEDNLFDLIDSMYEEEGE